MQTSKRCTVITIAVIASFVLLQAVIFVFYRQSQNRNSKRENAGIVYLLRYTPQDVQEICTSMKNLDQHFTKQFKYPIFIMHDQDVTTQDKQFIQNCTNSKTKFVQFEFPPIPENAQDVSIWQPPNAFPAGYRHMSQFWFAQLFTIPELQHLDYVMRLDTDSQILSTIGYDMFTYMKQHNKMYAYRSIVGPDPEFVTLQFWRHLQRFVSEHFIVPKQPFTIPTDLRGPVPNYNNNFEIFYMPRFRKSDYQQWVQFVLQSAGIYLYRWGDANLIYYAVQMFLEESQVQNFCDFDYYHQGFIKACWWPL